MDGLFGLMDEVACDFLHITMDQLNYISEKSESEEELQEMMDPVFNPNTTISGIKRSIQIRDKYLKQNGIWIELENNTK